MLKSEIHVVNDLTFDIVAVDFYLDYMQPVFQETARGYSLFRRSNPNA